MDKYWKIKYQTPPIGKEKIVLYLYEFDIEMYEKDLKQLQEKDYYTIKKGDTLWDIANKFGTTWEYLAKINRIKNPDLIYPTQRIKIRD